MKYIELSIKNVEEKTQELFDNISKEYDYDMVVFIAKGSYLIGKTFSDLKNVPLLEIYASRKGGKLKKILKYVVKFIPKKILIKLREKEMKSDYHEKNNQRKVTFNEKKYELLKNKKRILLVDDSIDSGNSIKLTYDTLKKYFVNSEIKIAVFNLMNKSTIKSDFCLYHDTMISGPWSNDSKEYDQHLKLYKNWKEEYEK